MKEFSNLEVMMKNSNKLELLDFSEQEVLQELSM